MNVSGQGYVSENLTLDAGDFKLTSFFLLNSADEIIYAAPLANCSKAQHIEVALPLAFSVAIENTTKVVPEVLAVTVADSPEDFGYTSFGFTIRDPGDVVPLKTTLKFQVGDIIYENIAGTIKVKGFDAGNNELWSKEYPFEGPADVLLIQKGVHHYTISTEKWGVTDSQSFSAQELWDNRANGPQPATYGLGGVVAAKKIDYYIDYLEPKDNTLLPHTKAAYQYNEAGNVDRITYYDILNDNTLQVSSYLLITWTGGAVRKVVHYRQDDSKISEDTYEYGDPEAWMKISRTDYASALTAVLNLNYADSFTKALATYEFSNGNNFAYQFSIQWKNMTTAQTTRGAELCDTEEYTYDRNINPLRHLGYVDFYLSNYYINNRLTENNNYIACSFPALVPEAYDYTYDDMGYPTTKTTHYKGKSYVGHTSYFYK